MAKVGKFQYPKFDLEYVENKIKTILDTIGREPVSRDVLADSLGMSTGGGFHSMVSTLTIYGFADAREGKVELKEKAEELIYGNEKEKRKRKEKAASNIRLFREIKKKYKSNPSKKQIRTLLRQKGNAGAKEAKKKVDKVRKIFLSVAEHVKTAEEPSTLAPQEQRASGGIGRREKTMPSEKTGGRPLTKIQRGSLYIELPSDNIEAMKTAKSTLEHFIKEQEKQEEQETEEG